MKTPGFESIYRRPPPKGRGFTSTIQRDYLHQSNPELAQNMEHYTSPTSFLPLRAPRRRRK